MGRQFSDAEKILASELSYLDFDGYEGYDLGTLVKNTNSVWNATKNPDSKLKAQKELVDSILSKAERNGVSDWQNWTIETVCNRNDESGYYGLLIDTGEGNAIVASRGSEFESGQFVRDWISNDVMFFNGDGTTSQEQDAEKFMESIWYKYGEKYESFTVTGHSLGGHLATHMAITAPRAMQEKINEVLSIDGPWFSEEYADKYKEQIDRMAPKMAHYKYSLVGGLLTPLPGVKERVICSNEDNIIERHSMKTIELDDYGNVKDGDERLESRFVHNITEGADRLSVQKLLFDCFPQLDEIKLTQVPEFCMQVFVYCLVKLIRVIDLVSDVMDEVKNWIADVQYKYIKPCVTGDYEMSYRQIDSILTEITNNILGAERAVIEAKEILHSIRSSWSGGAFLRSQIRANIRSMENDIKKLERLATIMNHALERYKRADNEVVNTFV